MGRIIRRGQYVDEQGQGATDWVMGMIAGKDHADVFKELLKAGDRLYLVPVPDHTPADLDEMVRVAQRVCPKLAYCGVYGDVMEGLDAALKANIEQANAMTVLCGSLYLIGHFFSEVSSDETA
jgi:dihydrofolate synthase / folylpolyglutamate synthase